MSVSTIKLEIKANGALVTTDGALWIAKSVVMRNIQRLTIIIVAVLGLTCSLPERQPIGEWTKSCRALVRFPQPFTSASAETLVLCLYGRVIRVPEVVRVPADATFVAL